jgi:glucose/mannose-6-phosphate isomerase
MRSYMKIAGRLLVENYEIPPAYADARNVIVIGMGGSGVVGSIVRDLTGDQVPKPIIVHRRPDLPAFAGEESLVIAVSYSGNTFETLSALGEAISRRCKIIGLTSGGMMKTMLVKYGGPYINVPEGYQPREALPFMLFPIFKIFTQFGWCREDIDVVGLDSAREEIENLAEKIAPRLSGKLALVYSEYLSVCHRFKSQLNENAKAPAQYDVMTELFHNEVNSWSAMKDFHVILLRDSEERRQIHDIVDIAKRLLDGSNYTEVFAKGINRPTRILYMIWLGDFVSYYLARENRVDPDKVPVIDYLKSEFSGLQEKKKAKDGRLPG